LLLPRLALDICLPWSWDYRCVPWCPALNNEFLNKNRRRLAVMYGLPTNDASGWR
jgi:hypothetical protein